MIASISPLYSNYPRANSHRCGKSLLSIGIHLDMFFFPHLCWFTLWSTNIAQL